MPSGWTVLAALAFGAGAAAIVLYGGEDLPYRLGEAVATPILAPHDFQREDPQRHMTLIKEAKENTPSVYAFNDALANRLVRELTAVHSLVKAAETFESFDTEASKHGAQFAKPAYQALLTLIDDAGTRRFDRWIQSLPERLADVPVVRRLEAADRDTRATHARLVDGPSGREQLFDWRRLINQIDRDQVHREIHQIVERLGEPELNTPLTGLMLAAMQPDPNDKRIEPIWVFDKARTDAGLEQTANSVPIQFITYKKGDALVGTGVIDEQEYLLLQGAWRAKRQALRTDPQLAGERTRLWVGTLGVALLMTLGLGLYTHQYVPRVLQNPTRAWALAAMLLVMLVLGRLLGMMGAAREWTVMPVVMAAAILSIAYNQRFATGVTAMLAILVTMSVNAGLDLFVVLLVAGGVTVQMLGDVRSRLKLLEFGAFAAAGTFMAAVFVNLMGRQDLIYGIGVAGWGALAALVGAVLVQTVLPLIEWLFGIVTSMTLLEWCDVNKPLLRRLAQEAPGTYNHSLMLGSMCETAAESIGANGLLGRVGSYYHDVGKIAKADYFIENYESRANRHENLSPTMSLLIIVGHVKDGLEMAREYGLPRVLHQFIAQHHGTTLVQYFYHAASEKSQAEGNAVVPESEFRYPGPKPQAKEAAILMLCDASEGAVRALNDPTPGRIESTVHTIAMQRLMDGQLDDCDITLKELAQVERSLVKSLCAIYHGRIAYPSAGAHRTSRTA